MIKIKEESIFKSDAELIVCPVNCKKVMGAGLALAFKHKFPQECKTYFTSDLTPGSVLRSGKVVFAATKDHWKDPSKIEWVSLCVDNIIALARELNITNIALPLLGAGLGKLSKLDVLSLISQKMEDTDLNVEVYVL